MSITNNFAFYFRKVARSKKFEKQMDSLVISDLKIVFFLKSSKVDNSVRQTVLLFKICPRIMYKRKDMDILKNSKISAHYFTFLEIEIWQ